MILSKARPDPSLFLPGDIMEAPRLLCGSGKSFEEHNKGKKDLDLETSRLRAGFV